jgi:hypothetical protein
MFVIAYFEEYIYNMDIYYLDVTIACSLITEVAGSNF